jgi:hypothetical protein
LSSQATDTSGKRLELLREVVPSLRRLAIIGNVGNRFTVLKLGDVHPTAWCSTAPEPDAHHLEAFPDAPLPGIPFRRSFRSNATNRPYGGDLAQKTRVLTVA